MLSAQIVTRGKSSALEVSLKCVCGACLPLVGSMPYLTIQSQSISCLIYLFILLEEEFVVHDRAAFRGRGILSPPLRLLES